MKLAAVTTFPPSRNGLSSFAFHAIRGFLESPEIEQIVVLADVVNVGELLDPGKRLTVERCWKYNSPSTPWHLLSAVARHRPDVVWLNLQYTTFGHNPVFAFLGLLTPALLKRLRCRLVVLLHNYLDAVDMTQLDISIPAAYRFGLRHADKIVMRSLLSSDKVLTMVKTYETDLLAKFPSASVRFIDQDLYKVPPFHPLCAAKHRIVTLGYWGTHKKLEILLEAFQSVRHHLPDARLLVGGTDSPHTAGYLYRLVERYADQLENVSFLGYVAEEDVPSFFWDANVVCITNVATPGVSGVLRLAATHGRAILAPNIESFTSLHNDGWHGIEYYEPGNIDSLASSLLRILTDPEEQAKMALANYYRSKQSTNQFCDVHLQAFRDLRAVR